MKKAGTAKQWIMSTLTIIVLTGSAYSEALIYDGFSTEGAYNVGLSLNGASGGTGFAGPWTVDLSANANNANRYVVLDHAPVYTDSKGNVLQRQKGSLALKAAGSGLASLDREFNKELTGTFWISFLTEMDLQIGYGWDIQFLDAAGEVQFKFMNGKKDQNRWRIQSMKTPNGLNKDGIFKSNPGMTPTDPTLVLLKVVNAGSGKANGQVVAYLNPTDLLDAEICVMGSLKISGLNFNAIKKIDFNKNTSAEGYFDELRIGTSLRDVLPLQK